MRNATRLVPVVLAAGLMVAACTGGGDDAAGTPSRGYDEAQTTTTMASTTIPAEGMPAGEEAAGCAHGDDGAGAGQPKAAPPPRLLVLAARVGSDDGLDGLVRFVLCHVSYPRSRSRR